jgi:hypothetical protein
MTLAGQACDAPPSCAYSAYLGLDYTISVNNVMRICS